MYPVVIHWLAWHLAPGFDSLRNGKYGSSDTCFLLLNTAMMLSISCYDSI